MNHLPARPLAHSPTNAFASVRLSLARETRYKFWIWWLSLVFVLGAFILFLLLIRWKLSPRAKRRKAVEVRYRAISNDSILGVDDPGPYHPGAGSRVRGGEPCAAKAEPSTSALAT